MAKLFISKTWNGEKLNQNEIVEIKLDIIFDKLNIFINAPFYNDKAPIEPTGLKDKLWEYEVVELFLVGEKLKYLEIELGPHGHYLVLQLNGIRHIERKDLQIEYTTKILGDHWHGLAKVPVSYLPSKVNKINAYAMHGEKENRKYNAAYPLSGACPDFHELNSFGKLILYKPISFL
jgi:hypothetical protein